MVRVRYLKLGLGLVNAREVLVLEFRVRARVTVKVRATVRDSWGTKRLGTKRLGYEMSGSLSIRMQHVCCVPLSRWLLFLSVGLVPIL